MVMQAVSTVPDVETVWETLPWLKKARVNRGGSVSIGKYSQPGWLGKLEFFIFRCKNCGRLNIDYLHGFEPGQYLSCRHC